MEFGNLDERKSHRAALSGRKAEKKKAKNQHVQELTAKQRNPKAFAIQSATKAERRFRRTMDIKSKSYHVPTVDRVPVKPPPAVVIIVGPPKVGKTTLMQCLIRNFTKQKMTSIKGPVTVVSGKKKRLTLIECNNDINCMIDVAKIADLVLLLIDAKSGFEMETFEFLNICQVHGMPRVMGVLTHLDLFKNKKNLQKTKTILKKRYRTEIPRGEKMFYFSGILHGEYLKNEVHNLGRFISVMKFQPSTWKLSHPYVLADRMEDITSPELLAKDDTCNRTICLYGYARGGALKKNSYFHIPGAGDYLVKNIHFLPDPCPLPEKRKKRSLNEKERLIYAPLSGVGGIVYDKDAVYIELKGCQQQNQKPEEMVKPSEKLLNAFITSHNVDEVRSVEMPLFASDTNSERENTIDDTSDEDMLTGDDKMQSDNELSLSVKRKNDYVDNENFINSSFFDVNNDDLCNEDDGKGAVVSEDSSGDETQESEESDDEAKQNVDNFNKSVKKSVKKVRFENASSSEYSDFDDDDDDGGGGGDGKKITSFNAKENEKSKDDLFQEAADEFYKRQQESLNFQKLVYGKTGEKYSEDNEIEKEEIGGLFYVTKYKSKKQGSGEDLILKKSLTIESRDWTAEDALDNIKDRFVTGKWDDSEDAQHLLEQDDELYGDFEDYEADSSKNPESNQETEEKDDKSEDDENTATSNIDVEKKEKTLHEKRMEKKRKLKEQFNAQFDDNEQRSYHDDLKMEADEQGELNKKEFENIDDEIRVQFEGYRPGLYVRLEVEQMPCEFVRHFDPNYPVIIGALKADEDKMGYLQVRLKKHRWYPKILKSRDPLIISLGWKRFQTIPVYYVTDHNGRNRLLKYTPKHLHCMASFWGPITALKSGLLAVQTVSEVTYNFRIAAIGSVTEVSQTTEIVKKLKLIGTPFEIFKKTAFIEGMFHSPLEVAKYEGAIIRTVSGIRGQIKKALRKPPGIFRATFEDRILKSDIVFLRTWVKVEVPQFCTSVCSLLLPPEQKTKWQGMKTLGRLRYERGLHAPVSEDSIYVPIERKLRQFAPLVIPKSIQKELPFRDKVKHFPKKTSNTENERVAVVREPHEREVAKVLSMLKTVHKLKCQKENRTMWLRARAHRKQKRKEDTIRHQKLQEKKKRIMRFKKPDKKL